MALVGRPSPFFSSLDRWHYLVHFPPLLRGKNSLNILKWSAYILEDDSYMLVGEPPPLPIGTQLSGFLEADQSMQNSCYFIRRPQHLH